MNFDLYVNILFKNQQTLVVLNVSKYLMINTINLGICIEKLGDSPESLCMVMTCVLKNFQ